MRIYFIIWFNKSNAYLPWKYNMCKQWETISIEFKIIFLVNCIAFPVEQEFLPRVVIFIRMIFTVLYTSYDLSLISYNLI